MTEVQGVGALLAVGGFILLFLLLGLVFYILFSLGLYTMAKRRDLPNAWLAWIPFAQIYTMGEVIGPVKLGSTCWLLYSACRFCLQFRYWGQSFPWLV
ncbi:MAG TPA: hypothetical protein PLM20_08240 [Syntrophomonadaceae bacterium]|nr:hypothetical protein [Syntrophomonadaceae bacterium]HQE23874.1 hypothetical protein [Syntrophomonadaceae bacterium]